MEGPFCPCRDLPGEFITIYPATVEEARYKQVSDNVLLQAIGMARAGEIRPTFGGIYVREWDGLGIESIERLILSAGEVRQVLATFPVPIDAPAVEPEGATLKRAALVKQHEHEWPTIERDLRDAHGNGLSAAAKAGRMGWREAAALEWAKGKGKLTVAPVLSFPSVTRHRSKYSR